MNIGAQMPTYGTTGLISSYKNSPSRTYNSELDAPRTGGRYINGVWTPDTANTGTGNDAPAPLTAPQVAVPGYNGSNPTTPNTLLPQYDFGSITKTIPGAGSSLTSQFSTASAGPVATASLPSAPELPNYAPPVDPAIADLNKQSFGNISQEFKGQLPADVQQQIQQRAAERGISTGVNSPNSGAAYLRALGLTSLDMTDRAQKAFQPIQLATISEQGDNFRAILGAKSALDQLKLSEAGQTSRFNAGEQNDLNKQVLSGKQALQQLAAKGQQDIALALINATAEQQNTILRGAQAMQQLQLSESGQGQRLNAQLAADLQKQVLAGKQALEQINAQGVNQRANTALSNQGNLDSIIAQYGGQANLQQQASDQYAAGFNSGDTQNINAGFQD